MTGKLYIVGYQNFYTDHWLLAGGLFCLEYNIIKKKDTWEGTRLD
ncbi:hypothetical protein [Anaerococcus vaginalis]|nr:hypothetical protein [Anaerococcus vaginalis]